jgi:hypothetical protein
MILGPLCRVLTDALQVNPYLRPNTAIGTPADQIKPTNTCFPASASPNSPPTKETDAER